MICPKCKAEILDNSKFCNICGEKINDLQKPKILLSKRKIVIIAIAIIALLVVIMSYFIFFQKGYDFRKARWGMTKAEIKQSETIAITDVDDNNMIASNVNFGDYSVNIDYQFNSGKLASAGYIYQDSNFESEEFTDAKSTYNSFINILEKQYGKPKTISNDENLSYKNCNTDKTIWETRNTTITVILSDLMGSNNLSVFYEPKNK